MPRQIAVRLHELPSVLRDQRLHNRDLYIAQNEFFRPNRRVVNCSRLTTCYVDLDTYKLDVCGRRCKTEPPCRLNSEPGVEPGFQVPGCG